LSKTCGFILGMLPNRVKIRVNGHNNTKGIMMMKKSIVVKLALIAGIMFVSSCLVSSYSANRTNKRGITATELRCEYLKNPLGIDTPQPRFSWIPASSQRGQMQSAYQVLVATDAGKLNKNIGDKWDSGWQGCFRLISKYSLSR